MSEIVSKQSPESQTSLFRDSGDCFDTVLDTWGRKGPGDSLGDFLGFRARRARETPVRGGAGSQETGLVKHLVTRKGHLSE